MRTSGTLASLKFEQRNCAPECFPYKFNDILSATFNVTGYTAKKYALLTLRKIAFKAIKWFKHQVKN